MLKSRTQAVFEIRLMSSPKTKQLRPATIPYWGSTTDRTIEVNWVEIGTNAD